MEAKEFVDVPRCLCRLESTSDYVLVSSGCTKSIPPDQNFIIVGSAETIEMASSGTLSRASDCCVCQGWRSYPNDDDIEHSIEAQTVLTHVAPKVRENRLSLTPVVQELVLNKYRYAPGDEKYYSYYFLYVHAGHPGDNFFLYIKAGVLRTDNIDLLRVCSQDNTCAT